MIHRMAKYKVKKEKLEDVKNAIIEFVDAVKKNEPGTQVYEAFQEDDEVSFVHLMSFEDANARNIHRNSSYLKKFVDLLYPNCDEQPVFTDLHLIRSNRRS